MLGNLNIRLYPQVDAECCEAFDTGTRSDVGADPLLAAAHAGEVGPAPARRIGTSRSLATRQSSGALVTRGSEKAVKHLKADREPAQSLRTLLECLSTITRNRAGARVARGIADQDVCPADEVAGTGA